MTEAERKLWAKLRSRSLSGAKFRRQVPIGSFVADFASIEVGLAIEIDGGQHASAATADAARSAVLAAAGFRVLRFWNNEVLVNTDGVLATIARVLDECRDNPHPDPLPQAGEGGTRVSGRVREPKVSGVRAPRPGYGQGTMERQRRA
ncbi:conserved hypothetical protein [uncultured Defluviicoccus sp.]|uniref:DUF559 domain-containing protein n=1 Tax=metagenome TaxID=256318 RepID=A0A380TC72_9ZZZZ|nr:conserved hypothetical protein [uncultured Defluviicoccus sp.]